MYGYYIRGLPWLLIYQSLTPTFYATVGGVSKYSLNYTRDSYSGSGGVTLKVRGSTSEGIHFLNVTGGSGDTFIDVSGNGTGRIGAVDSITQQGTRTQYVSLVNLYMLGDLGAGLASSDDAINVYTIGTVDVAGNVRDAIVAHESVIGTVVISGDMVRTNASNPATINGKLGVGTIQIGGSFGSSTYPEAVQYGDYLQHLTAASIYGDIYSNRLASANATIWSVETTGGPFVGSLQCETLQSSGGAAGITIDGGATAANGILDADISILTTASENIEATGGLASGRTVTITGPYSDTITLPSAGLKGQTIVNASNDSSTWTGSLVVGGTTVSGTPYYSATAASLGGGAVGLAPFHLHGTACYPPAGSTIPTPSPTVPLEYTFYGPIKSSSSAPIFVSRREVDTTGDWEDITSEFTYTISGRTVYIHESVGYWLESGYDYQIVPDTSLLCDGLATGSDVGVYPSPYQFKVSGPDTTGCDTDCE